MHIYNQLKASLSFICVCIFAFVLMFSAYIYIYIHTYIHLSSYLKTIAVCACASPSVSNWLEQIQGRMVGQLDEREFGASRMVLGCRSQVLTPAWKMAGALEIGCSSKGDLRQLPSQKHVSGLLLLRQLGFHDLHTTSRPSQISSLRIQDTRSLRMNSSRGLFVLAPKARSTTGNPLIISNYVGFDSIVQCGAVGQNKNQVGVGVAGAPTCPVFGHGG